MNAKQAGPRGIYGVGFEHIGGGFSAVTIDGRTYRADELRCAVALWETSHKLAEYIKNMEKTQ